MTPANSDSAPSRSITPPSATCAEPRPTFDVIAVSSMRTSLTSPRRSSVLPFARSRSNEPNPRVGTYSASTGLLVSAERATDEIPEAYRDEQRASGMFLHLLLDARLHAVDVGVAEPLRAALHPARDTIRDLCHASVVRDRRAARAGGAGKRRVGSATVAQPFRAGLEGIRKLVLRGTGALTHARAHVGQLVSGVAERGPGAILQILRRLGRSRAARKIEVRVALRRAARELGGAALIACRTAVTGAGAAGHAVVAKIV